MRAVTGDATDCARLLELHKRRKEAEVRSPVGPGGLFSERGAAEAVGPVLSPVCACRAAEHTIRRNVTVFRVRVGVGPGRCCGGSPLARRDAGRSSGSDRTELYLETAWFAAVHDEDPTIARERSPEAEPSRARTWRRRSRSRRSNTNYEDSPESGSRRAAIPGLMAS